MIFFSMSQSLICDVNVKVFFDFVKVCHYLYLYSIDESLGDLMFNCFFSKGYFLLYCFFGFWMSPFWMMIINILITSRVSFSEITKKILFHIIILFLCLDVPFLDDDINILITSRVSYFWKSIIYSKSLSYGDLLFCPCFFASTEWNMFCG